MNIPLQKNVIRLIRKSLRKGTNKFADKDWKLSRSIENSIYRHSQQKRRFYCRTARSLIYNLGNVKRNPQLNENVLKGSISPNRLVLMSPHELFPDLRKDFYKRKAEQEEWKRVYRIKLEKERESMIGLFQCRKCKSRQTEYFQLQTRSADEPLTTYHSCLHCGNRWKS